MLSKRSVFRACNLNTLSFFFLLIHLESSFSQVEEWQKSSQSVWRISLDKRGRLLQFLFFFCQHWKEIQHTSRNLVLYWQNRSYALANWALSTWFMTMRTYLFVSALGAVWGLLPVYIILPFICNHLASIDIHLYLKQISNQWRKLKTCWESVERFKIESTVGMLVRNMDIVAGNLGFLCTYSVLIYSANM